MSRQAPKLKCNPPIGSLPVLQFCAPEQLLIDESYQRSLEADSSQSLVRRIAAHWDWGLCQPLFVARRADGGLYVVDGQHRLAAALLRGDINQLPCVVRDFPSSDLEAAAFVALNQQRRPLTSLDLFKAAIAAGDMEATQIVQCLAEAGLALASTTNNQLMRPGQVGNVGGLQRCYRTHGQLVLTVSLKVLAKSYPQQRLRYAGSIFPGIVVVAARELDRRADIAGLVDSLAAFIGSAQQHEWYRRFAIALGDDPLLKRSQASERVITRAWEAHKEREAAGAVTLEKGTSPAAEVPTPPKHPKSFDEQLAAVERGEATVVPAFHPKKAVADQTLGGVASAML
ncbi:MAG: DUF6551 family protein [Bacillota bacterium]